MAAHYRNTDPVYRDLGALYAELHAIPTDRPAATGALLPRTREHTDGEHTYLAASELDDLEPAYLAAIEIGLDDATGNANTPTEIDPIATPAKGKRNRYLRHVYRANSLILIEHVLLELGFFAAIRGRGKHKYCYLKGNPHKMGNILTEKNVLYLHSTKHPDLRKAGKYTVKDTLRVVNGELTPLVLRGLLHRDRMAVLIYFAILREAARVDSIRSEQVPAVLAKHGLRLTPSQVRTRLAWLVRHGLLVKDDREGVYKRGKPVVLLDPYEIPLVFSAEFQQRSGRWGTRQYIVELTRKYKAIRFRALKGKGERIPNPWGAYLEYLADPTPERLYRLLDCVEQARQMALTGRTPAKGQAPNLPQPLAKAPDRDGDSAAWARACAGVRAQSMRAASNGSDSLVPIGVVFDRMRARAAWLESRRMYDEASGLQAGDDPPDSPQDAAQDEGRQRLRRICANLLTMAAQQEAQRAQGMTPAMQPHSDGQGEQASGLQAGSSNPPDSPAANSNTPDSPDGVKGVGLRKLREIDARMRVLLARLEAQRAQGMAPVIPPHDQQQPDSQQQPDGQWQPDG